MHSTRELMDLAASLASQAGQLVIEGRSQAEVTLTKSSPIDIVTQMDVAAEKLLRSRLAQERPDDAILGEEGEDVPGKTGVTWVIDPIDGTVNYLYGLPHFAVSVAAVEGGTDPASWRVLAGAVYGGGGVEWKAAAGHGAWRNGKQLERGEAPALASTLVATGFSYVAERRVAQGRVVAELLGQVRDIRRLGAASLDLCLVAEGSVDAYYEHGLKPWDFAAGSLIAQEAGVRVGGIDGGAADGELLIAAAPEAWDEFRDVLERAGARLP
ncbi:inositol monophosphatase [Demequina sp. TTPB684]|uniref:inositol monophosphatase family protein n=1 Tax=unclassified Demequina TaxID=2620311 RepID=UPI001CF2AAC3|nr:MULTISPECIES: inositol monophosphatase family protein [unclassified Demequina]MCB2413864.1 inositol monophosphatase [Demequina sp. TTPB684]UPU89176.1 inositol monophosphatase [Demequina sp. TMPB413]